MSVCKVIAGSLTEWERRGQNRWSGEKEQVQLKKKKKRKKMERRRAEMKKSRKSRMKAW